MKKRTPIDWYRERAEWFGMLVHARVHNPDSDDEYTHGLAMLSAHFGALVLGYASLEGKQFLVMDARISEPIQRFYVPHGLATEA